VHLAIDLFHSNGGKYRLSYWPHSVQIAAPEGFSTRLICPALTTPGSLKTQTSLLVSIIAFDSPIMPLFPIFYNLIPISCLHRGLKRPLTISGQRFLII
jgi:hypothetical protein